MDALPGAVQPGRAVIRRVAAGLWLALAVTLAGGGSAAARPLDDVVDSGTLIVAVYRDYPPFSYRNAKGLAGIDVDIAGEVASALGVGLQLMPVTADETVDDDLRNAVWKGHYLDRRIADLMLHVPVDRQFALRNDQAVIFGSYFLRRIALAYDPERLDGGDPPLFAAETIAVEVDSLGDFFLSGAYGGQRRNVVVRYRTAAEAIASFRAGAAAAVIAPESEIEAGLGPARRGVRIEPVTMGGFRTPAWPIGAAVKEDSRDLRYAVGDILAAMVADGRMAEIFARHGVTYRSPLAE